MRTANAFEDRYERIFGDGAFVERILSESQETLDRRYALKTESLTVFDVANHVEQLLDITIQQFWQTGKFKQQVVARSLLCYWSVHELGDSMIVPGKRLTISTVAVSKSVRRGAKIVDVNGWKFKNQGYPQRSPLRGRSKFLSPINSRPMGSDQSLVLKIWI